MSYWILSINPGSTSTKVAVYEDEQERFTETIPHTDEELARFASQLEALCDKWQD